MRSTISFLFLAGLIGLTLAGTAVAQTVEEPKVVRWEKNVTLAYNKAMQEKKALVIVYVCPLIQEKCVHCKRFRASLFADEFNTLAGRAVFVLCELDARTVYKKSTSPSLGMDGAHMEAKGWDERPKNQKPADEPGVNLFKALKGKGTPMVSILEPNPAMIAEIARLSGYFDAKGLSGHVDQILTKWTQDGSKITPPPQAQK